MSAEQNKSIVRRWVEEDWNKGNAVLIDELFTPNFYQHETGPETVNSREALKPFYAGYLTAFPDLQFTIEDLITEGDKVVWRFKATGNNTGPFMGGPVTGKSGRSPSALRTAAWRKPGSTSMCWVCCSRWVSFLSRHDVKDDE